MGQVSIRFVLTFVVLVSTLSPAWAQATPPAGAAVSPPAPAAPPGAPPVPPEAMPGAPPATYVPPGEPPAAGPGSRPWQLGILLGIISLPRPIQVEVALKLSKSLAFGAQYSVLPTLTVPGQDDSLQMNATQAVVRWFPFSGVFYVGSGIGYQQLNASLSQTVQGGKLNVTADMSTIFISPQLGWLWTWRSGFALGINLGVQVPFPKDPVVTATYNGQPVPEQGGAGIPTEVSNSARDARTKVADVARVVMKYPVPNIDLLKIGFFF